MELPRAASWACVTTLFLLGVSGAAASHGNDAGLGVDAPNDWSAAAAVPVAAFSGALVGGENDQADWYALAVPAGIGLRIVVSPRPASIQLEVRAPWGQTVWSTCCPGQSVPVEAFVGPWVGTAIVGVLRQGADADYDLSVETVPLHDLVIDRVRIVNEPVRTDVWAAPTATQRTLEVFVSNRGPGAAFATGVNAWVQHDYGERQLGGVGIPPLAPGQSFVARLPWDGTGEAGDATVHVDAGSALEMAYEDNHVAVRSYVLVGGLGFGVDALSHGGSLCPPGACANAQTGYHAWGRGAWLDWNGPALPNNGHLHLGSHPGQVHAQAQWGSERGFSHVEAGHGGGRLDAHACLAELPQACSTGFGWAAAGSVVGGAPGP